MQMTATDRHGTVNRTTKLNQPRYFRAMLILKKKSKDTLHGGRGFALGATGKEKLWIPAGLIWIRFNQESPPDT